MNREIFTTQSVVIFFLCWNLKNFNVVCIDTIYFEPMRLYMYMRFIEIPYYLWHLRAFVLEELRARVPEPVRVHMRDASFSNILKLGEELVRAGRI